MRGMHLKNIIRRFRRTNMSRLPQASGSNAKFLTNKKRNLWIFFFLQIFKAYHWTESIAKTFNALLLILINPGEDQSSYGNCTHKAEFLLVMLLSSCNYKTEAKILMTAKQLTRLHLSPCQSTLLNELKCTT